jgi:hypothetical protein
MSRKRHRPLRHGFTSLLSVLGLLLAGCRTSHSTAAAPPASLAQTGTFSAFITLSDFSRFTSVRNNDGSVTLLSPPIKSTIPWNQLIVSWNTTAPAGSFMKVEASVIYPDHHSAFYTLGRWSPDNQQFQRTSVPGQKDDDGQVDTDTLILPHLADTLQLRLTLGNRNAAALPRLKFLGLSFANTQLPPLPRAPNRLAWGKTIAVPESSQHGYPGESGLCSPACVSMVLASWSLRQHRPDLIHDVPFVASKVYDAAYRGTGNWPFNTAFAGSYPGMRAYVTRLDDLAEVEDWIAAGIPVILSARWDWLSPGRLPDAEGHLIVCLGFTPDGDVIANDPSAHLTRGEPIQRIYKRADVIHAWSKSHHAVYLIYPETVNIPSNQYGHWETR